MKTWIAVALGGALGAMARHGLNHVIHQGALSSTFPIGIFVINVTGSVLIGLLAGALASGRLSLSLTARTFLVVGVLGGLTTFSSISLDTLALVRDRHMDKHSGMSLDRWGSVCSAYGQGFAWPVASRTTLICRV